MLILRDVSKSFGDEVLFTHLSYAAPQTGLIRLSGTSGTGKTTLLRMIAGLDRDYEGTLEVSGTCSFLFQDRRLFESLSALDNVAIAARKRGEPMRDARRRAADLLAALHLSAADEKKRPSELSGGMQQRVAIARALLFPADILLLDEPTKELDEENRLTVMRLIEQEAEHRLVLMVTHDEDPLSGSTGIRFLEKGDPGSTGEANRASGCAPASE